MDKWETPYSLVAQMRASTAVLGPLVSRFGRAVVAMERLLDVEEMYALVIDPEEGCDTGTPAAWAATNARVALEGPQAAAFREALGTKGMSLLG